MAETRRRLTRDAASSDDEGWEDVNRQARMQSPSGSQYSVGALSPRKRRAPRLRPVGTPTQRKYKPRAPSPSFNNDSLVLSRSPRSPAGAPTPPHSEPDPTRPPPARKPESRRISSDDVHAALSSGAVSASTYVIDVVGTAVRLLKRPISFFLFLYLLGLLLARASSTIRSTLSPLCFVPGLSRLCPAPLTHAQRGANKGHDAKPQWADYPGLVRVQGQTLGALLDEAGTGRGLALEIAHAQIATRDLAALVAVSDLTARDALAESLTGFVKAAQKAGRGLQRFSAKVSGAVDNVMAVNDYALHAIEAANKPPSALIVRTLWPFATNNAEATKEVVTKTFMDAMSALSLNMRRLVVEAEVSLGDLEQLEERLSSLAELIAREDSAISSTKADLLADLWTRLGGNRKAVRGLNGHLALLKGLGAYRQQAVTHVMAALQTLQGMSEEMEELRARVAAPELIGERIPIEVHMKSIRSGLDRLKERRVKAIEREEQIVSKVLAAVTGSETALAIG